MYIHTFGWVGRGGGQNQEKLTPLHNIGARMTWLLKANKERGTSSDGSEPVKRGLRGVGPCKGYRLNYLRSWLLQATYALSLLIWVETIAPTAPFLHLFFFFFLGLILMTHTHSVDKILGDVV